MDERTDGRQTDGQPDGQRQTVSDHNSSLSTLCSGELKSLQNCLIAEIYKVQRASFRQKSMEHNETQIRSVSHGD